MQQLQNAFTGRFRKDLSLLAIVMGELLSRNLFPLSDRPFPSSPGSSPAEQKARRPPVLPAKQDIRRVIDALPEPTRSIVTLMVVGSLRVGEATGLRIRIELKS